MILRDGTYYDGGTHNRMILLLMYRIIQLHDAVYKFAERENIDELVRLKNYLTEKMKRRALL